MTWLVWSEDVYGTGVPEIDRQHQELFARVNSLNDACQKYRGTEEIGRLIGFLSTYVDEHFSCEERLMESRRCSGCVANLAGHAKFRKMFADLKSQFDRDGPTTFLTIQLQGELFRWFDDHIRKIDVVTLRDTEG